MRAILLDLDDTLLDDRHATQTALDEFMTFHAEALPGVSRDHMLALWRSIAARHWLRYESGEITFVEQRRERVREFLRRPLTEEEADEAYRPYGEAYAASWRLLPGVTEFLATMRHVPKVIVTNGEREQQLRKLRVTGLSEHVVGVVTPADCGQWKPHPTIFLTALRLLGVEPGECLMIGDDPVRDIEPAKRLGMRCLLVEAGYAERSFSNVAREEEKR